jgi:regulator of sirC expression with transglutaminase-like and TPR domain
MGGTIFPALVANMQLTNPTPAYCRPKAYSAFARELPHIETTPGLFRAAFAIARHDRPTADVEQSLATIENLADTVRHRVRSASTEARLAHLHDVLFDVVGLCGNVDDYYNPANSYLPDVLQTRRGLPITLVLIYKAVAERVGLVVHGINSPGHFLAAVEIDAETPTGNARPLMYVDPFYGGTMLNEADVFQRITDTTGDSIPDPSRWLAVATGRQWLARMLVNLQAAFAALGRERDLLAMQELEVLLSASKQ